MGLSWSKLGLDFELLKASARVCVAVSGGADSTALLVALGEANVDPKAAVRVTLTAAHVHHGLRGADADADEAFVRGLCERLGVALTVFRVDTAARQQTEGEGLEEAARSVRYAALRGLVDSGEADAIATAHTLDDQAETVIMKLLRGAWTDGLGGISPVVAAADAQVARGVVRPMLKVRRAQVEAFLRQRGQAWREDGSNADVSLTRNRVRHELMPVLRSFNPQVDEMLANVAELARDDQAYWEAEVARLLPHLLLPGKPVRGGGRAVGTAVGERAYSIELERLKSLPVALRRRVVRAAALQAGVRLSFEETAKVMALAGFGGYAAVTGKIGSRLELHGGLRVERSARELRLWIAGAPL